MIRPALPSDHADIAELAVAAGLFPPEEAGIVEDLLADHTARTQAQGHTCVVDDEDGQLVGVAYYEPVRGTDGAWELLMIGVRQDHQGQGRGSRLMHHIEDDLRARGQRLLLVQTSGTPDFQRARAFYTGLGYTDEARVRDYYQSGDDMILYRLALRPSGG